VLLVVFESGFNAAVLPRIGPAVFGISTVLIHAAWVLEGEADPRLNANRTGANALSRDAPPGTHLVDLAVIMAEQSKRKRDMYYISYVCL
jgi:hypothetical protein